MTPPATHVNDFDLPREVLQAGLLSMVKSTFRGGLNIETSCGLQGSAGDSSERWLGAGRKFGSLEAGNVRRMSFWLSTEEEG